MLWSHFLTQSFYEEMSDDRCLARHAFVEMHLHEFQIQIQKHALIVARVESIAALAKAATDTFLRRILYKSRYIMALSFLWWL